MAGRLTPPLEPMLAKSTSAVPTGAYAYEPKWDGFRCLVFRDGGDVYLGSRSKKPLGRYFPELVEVFASDRLPPECVLDGEIVVPVDNRLDFDRLSDRIHPAESRVDMLARETPASYVAFDLLAVDGETLLDTPFEQRRQRLETALSHARAPVHLTRWTRDHHLAEQWFEQFEGAGLDGVVAKPLDAPYSPGKRSMLKTKHHRTAEAVVAGYRPHKNSTPDRPLLGSMLLGLYDDFGVLQFVGACSAFSTTTRAELADRLDSLRVDLGTHPWAGGGREGRVPGAPSRWTASKDMSFVPLEPSIVAEVAYDQLQSGRFRHATQLLRFRPDRDPASCTYAQLQQPVDYDLTEVLG